MARTRAALGSDTLERWRQQANEVSGRNVAAGLLARVEHDGTDEIDDGRLIVAWREAVRVDDPVLVAELDVELTRRAVPAEWREHGIPEQEARNR